MSALSVAGFVGCGVNADGPNGDSSDSDITSSITLSANQEKTITLDAQGASDATVTLDCSPPADPDDQGPVVAVTAATLGVKGDPARAGYWSHTGPMPAGQNTLTVKNQGSTVQCRVTTTAVPAGATCKARDEWRSPNTDHTHYRVGEQGAAAGWDPFPASGNHWGAWAKWDSIYDTPVKTGFVLHNLEHGGIVFSYKCSSPNDSQACKDARDQLVAIAQTAGGPRVIVTPDPSQPTMFAVRAWRYAYTSDCFDKDSAAAFAKKHYRNGREDLDADPPIPFDPTTLNVPCQDLMAAPDSCN
jgi:hypothetical protein